MLFRFVNLLIQFCHDFCHLLACGAAWLVFGMGVSERDEHGWLFVFWQVEELVAELGVEVAHPACAESDFSCGKADVLGGDGDVDVAVVFAVEASVP